MKVSVLGAVVIGPHFHQDVSRSGEIARKIHLVAAQTQRAKYRILGIASASNW